MRKRFLVTFLIGVILLMLPSSALAQSYSFNLTRQTVDVYWNADGTLSLDYVFVFANQPGAAAIDFVDVGLPNSNYDFSSISAERDGHPLNISTDYQGEGGSGVAVELGPYAIRPGETGNVHVYVGRISGVLYKDDQSADYASAVFIPTYFGSQYVTGLTELTVTFHLPPGVQPEEPRYHTPSANWPGFDEPEAGFDASGRITYTWHSTAANASERYTFGASFPARYVPPGAIVQPPAFNFSIDFDSIFACFCISLLMFLFVGTPILSARADRKRKLQYLPPKISIEGHGIKRGLTAVEAAILMETPLDKVMTMILFGVVKKGAAEVVTRDPLELKIADPLPEGLHGYEKEFLDAFREPTMTKRRQALQQMTVALVRSVADKMKGFSRKETVEYYRSIMERAWQQIKEAGTPEVQSELLEKALEWTMLDRDFDDRSRDVFGRGPIYVPSWWGRYDPVYRSSGGGVKAATPAPGGRVSLPGSAFAASVVTSVQNFSSKVIGDLTGFTSRVTGITNPPPVSSSGGMSKGGGRSGGGCACACACACAGCACACAGGGR